MGLNHPDTMLVVGRLAHAWNAQGRYEEAEAMEFQVLELRQSILGEHHPECCGLCIV